jgi:ABC-2 type transport system permease protein
MNITWLIARRELSGYLRTWTGYIVAASILLLAGIFFNALCMPGEKRSADVLREFFFYMSGLTMVASIFISMRLIAEERQTGTLVLLTSSPVHDREIILGKFLSGFIFLAVMILLSAFLPVLIMVNGKLTLGQIFAGYLGVLLYGAASLAIGTFASTLVKSQLLAVIIAAAMLAAMVLLWMLALITERPLNDVFQSLAIFQRHQPPFHVGVIHLRDIVYYLALSYFALFASIRVLEARRWR